MTLEAVIYQQDPFIYGIRDYNNYTMSSLGGYGGGGVFGLDTFQDKNQEPDNHLDINNIGEIWDSPPPHNASSSSETGDGFFPGGEVAYAPPSAAAAPGRRKRRRTKSLKNKEEMENQRMTHITVERNRRRQMNDYLAVLRSLMPPSYAQRGDQASIVGGAINFVKELEQLHQFLEAHKLTDSQHNHHHHYHHHQKNVASNMFTNFFTFPQYSMTPTATNSPSPSTDTTVEKRSNVADIEVAMVESHANIKILSKRRPKQLLKMVNGLQSLCLSILHLNITTVDQSVLYSLSVKVEDDCHLSTVNEIATAVHEMMEMIQQDFIKSNGGQAAT